jgi:hypothetical protein
MPTGKPSTAIVNRTTSAPAEKKPKDITGAIDILTNQSITRALFMGVSLAYLKDSRDYLDQ